MRKFHVINGTLEKRFKPRKFVTGVQSVGARPTSNFDNTSATMGVASTTMSGFASGGAAGAALGLFTGLVKRDKEKRAAAEQLAEDTRIWKADSLDAAQSGTLEANQLPQQLAQIAKGVYATGTEAVEVEKDELIFTKSQTGQYSLKADFQGGKTHNQGGEDYEAQDGDIIFPGKDRKKVMKAYKAQDYPKLESMRMSLPKDVPGGKAELGVDGTDPTQQYRDILDQVEAGALSQSFADNFYRNNKDNIHDPNLIQQGLHAVDNFLGNINPITQAWRGAGHLANFVNNDVTGKPKLGGARYIKPTTIEEQYGGDKGFNLPLKGQKLTGAQMIEDLNSFRYNYSKDNTAWYGPDQRLSPKGSNVKPSIIPEIAPIKPKGSGGPRAISGGDVEVHGLDNGGGLVGAGMQAGLNTPIMNIQGIGGADGATTPDVTGAGGAGKFDIGGAAGYAAQGFAALTNLFPGKAEVQTTPRVNLDRLRYTDTSEGLRQKAKINERVQASNARNVSGGNVQNYLANRKQVGLDYLRNVQGINSEEFRRSIGVANRNVGIANRESLYNSQLGIRDADVNAANRGARRNIQSAGIGQLGELGATVSRDRNANRNQAELRKAISSGMYRIGADGTIELNN